MEALHEKAKMAEVVEKLNELIEAVNHMARRSRNRGPESTREMTEEDARRILLGDLKTLTHKEAADKLGLSYGQIYSARKGFTFKHVYNE